MDKIKAKYTDYDTLIKHFGANKISQRIRFFIDAINSFLESINNNGQLVINDNVLTYCVLDYFTDIYRLKNFHEIELANDIKRVAYESKWLLRRKPIQILSSDVNDDAFVYANEKFVLSYIIHELFKERVSEDMPDKTLQRFRAFSESLFYHLKYRDVDAQVLELMMIAFEAGTSLPQKES